MIAIEKVTVDYGQRRILDSIDFEIQAGEFVSIVGETGCGKSTLLRLLLAEEMPSSGRVLVNGVARTQPDRHCGYVPQRYSLFPDKTVLDNVMFGPLVMSKIGPGYFKRKRAIADEALEYLRHTGLTPADATKYPHQLSGGMQQRVAIAQALIMKPEILLMDEAFSALDPATRSGMQRLIKRLWSELGTTIVFVTHNTREAVCLATRVIGLAKHGESGSSIAVDFPVEHIDFDCPGRELDEAIEHIERGPSTIPEYAVL